MRKIILPLLFVFIIFSGLITTCFAENNETDENIDAYPITFLTEFQKGVSTKDILSFTIEDQKTFDVYTCTAYEYNDYCSEINLPIGKYKVLFGSILDDDNDKYVKPISFEVDGRPSVYVHLKVGTKYKKLYETKDTGKAPSEDLDKDSGYKESVSKDDNNENSSVVNSNSIQSKENIATAQNKESSPFIKIGILVIVLALIAFIAYRIRRFLINRNQ